jgi:hypothetical protein
MVSMRRRKFITILGGAAAAWPLAARAQQFGKMPRVGVLVSLSAPHPFTEAFRSGMSDLGYIEGRNIANSAMTPPGFVVRGIRCQRTICPNSAILR